MGIREHLATERARLARFEAEADKVRDRKGNRSPVDVRLIAFQRNVVWRIERLLSEDSASG